MQPGSVFWDIGANVGALTLYAAQRGDLEVWAFEPAAVNYYCLAANCELNGFEKRVRCLQLGFSDKIEIADLHVSQLMTALSFTFKESKKNKPNKKTYPSIQAVQLCTRLMSPGSPTRFFSALGALSRTPLFGRFRLRLGKMEAASALPNF